MNKFGFFNSMSGDRKCDADDISNFFFNLISDGVLANPADNLKVVQRSGMTVSVEAGYAMIKAKYYKAESANVLTIDPADADNPRIDRVCIGLNYSARNLSLYVKKGTAAASPTAPELTRTAGVLWEICLAEIAVGAGATAITTADITDKRADTTLCGYITGLIEQIDTTDLFAQFTAAFYQWFDSLTQSLILDVSVVTKHSVYRTTAANEITIPIGISDYNPTTDALSVYVNGLRLIPDVDYTAGDTTITLTNALSLTGTTVFFEALVNAATPPEPSGLIVGRGTWEAI
jgi:hypothetical protein